MTRQFGLSRRATLDGGFNSQPGARGVTQYYADSIPLPSGSIAPVPALKSLNLAQALLDGLKVLGGLIALVLVFGSLPFAVGLLLFARF
jgi:hypothetical protein